MSRAALTLHFRNEETLRNLERAAVKVLERLKSYGPADLDQDIEEFAQSEVEIEDPLQVSRLE